jgi:hypothetical protein
VAGHSYTWSLASGGTIVSNPNSATVDIQFANISGSHVIKVIDTDANGCTFENTLSIVIITSPTVIAASNTPCVGKDLTLNSSASGGQAPYSYNWSGSNAFAISNMQNITISNVMMFNAGIYTVTVTDLNGCTGKNSTNAIINALPNASITSNTPVCETGKIELSASGGTSYIWSGPATFASSSATPSINNAMPSNSGTYSVTISNINACSVVQTTNLVVNAKPAILTVMGDDAPCANSTIAYNVTANAGSTYAWSLPSGGTFLSAPNTNNVSVLWSSSGVHTLKVTETDANGCSRENLLTISIKNNPTASASATTPCVGKDLNLIANATSGTSPYTYNWSHSNGYTNTTQNPIISDTTTSNSGNYNVTITDIEGCTATASINAIINPLPTGTVSNNSPVCEQSTINLTATGGQIYMWSGADNFVSTSATPSILNANVLKSGTYTVTITDVNTCSIIKTTIVTVNPKPANLSISGNFEPCANGTYMYSILPTAGNSYSWSLASGGSFLSSPTANTVTIAWNTSGTHVLKITETDANGCTQESTLTTTIQANPTTTASATTPCNGKDLNLNATPNGGSLPYIYNWTGPNTYTNSIQNPTIVNATAANAGTYNVTLTDAKGCTALASANAVINGLPTGTANNNGPICEGSTLNLTASGGTNYTWTGPNSFIANTATPSITNVSSSNSGVYNVTITDNSGCSITQSTTLTVNDKPLILTITGNTKPCTNGIYTYGISPTAGSNYAWSISSGGVLNSVPTGNSVDIQWGTSGSHIVNVIETNANGCSQTSSKTIVIQPLPMISANSNPICLNQTLSLNAVPGAGTAPYTFAWLGVNSFASLTQNNSILPAMLADAGTYNVTVTDANGCTASTSINATVNMLPTATANNNGAICENATLNFSATGGVSYAWAGPNIYTSNSASPTIQNAIPSQSGVYTVTVTDINGCVNTTTTNVVVNAKPAVLAIAGNLNPCAIGIYTYSVNPAGTSSVNWSILSGGTILTNPNSNAIQVQFSGTGTPILKVVETSVSGCTQESSISPAIQASPTALAAANSPCVDKTLSLNVATSGGTLPYVYSWTGNGILSSTTIQNPSILNTVLTDAGTYNVTVTDSFGCTATAATNVVINILPIATASNNGSLCENAVLNLNVTGGTTYDWKGVNNFTSNAAMPMISNVSSLQSGTYNVTVTNANSCTATAMTNVVVNAKPSAIAVMGNTLPCANGTYTYFVTEKSGSSYFWNIPTGATLLTPAANDSVSILWSYTGTHTIEVTETDINGCQKTSTINATIQPLPTLNVAATTPCNGKDLNLSATPSNGTPTFAYNWTGPNSFTSSLQNPIISNAAAASIGTYSVTLTDMNACTAVANINANINNLPSGSASNNGSVCQNSTIALTAVGGQTYQWSGPNGFASTVANPTIPNATVLYSGDYNVTVYDANNCQSFFSTTVVVNPKPAIVLIGGNVKPCLNATEWYFLTKKPNSSYTFALSSGGIFASNPNKDSVQITWTTSGTHSVSVTETDVNGCTQISILNVNTQQNPTATTSVNTPCSGKNLNFTATAIGGQTPYTYTWSGVNNYSNTVQNPSISGATASQSGIYTVTITDANACTIIATANAIVNALPIPTAISNGTICENETINLTATGGSTYKWSGPNSFASSSAAPTIPNATPIATGNYVVTVTDANGCSAVTTTFAGVEVKPAIISINGNINPCANSTQLYYITQKAGSTYNWTLPSGGIFITSPISDTVKIQWTNVGTHTVNIREIDVNGCTQISSLNINIQNLPSVTLAATIPCSGKDLNLNATPSGGTSPYLYAWTGVNTFVSSNQNPIISNSTAANNGVYQLTLTDNYGCTVTSSINVNINNLPIGEATGTSPICMGTSVNISAIGGTNYLWTGPNGFTSTKATNTIPNAILANEGNYIVTISDAKGCQIIDTIMVVVNEKPATLTILGNVTPCLSATNTYYIPKQAGYTYNWNLVSGGVFAGAINKDSVQIQWSATGVHVLKVTYTNSSGCTQTSEINPNVQNPMTATAVATTPCADKDLQLNANYSGGLAPYTFAWSGPNTYSATAQNPIVSSVQTNQAGTYYVTVSDANGCKSVASTTAGIKPLPNATISNNTPTCKGSTVLLNATGGSTYDWAGANNFTSSSNAPTIINAQAANSGMYNVTITDNQGCSIVKTTNVLVNDNLAPTAINGNIKPCAHSIQEYYYVAQAGHTYTWTVLSGGIIFSNPNNDTIKVKWDNAGVHSIRLLDMDANGCSRENILNTETQNLPIVKAAATRPCSGNDINLNAIASSGTMPFVYSWEGINGFTASTSNTTIPNATASSTGFYKVTVTDINGCKARDSVFADINTLPTGAVENNGPICEGKTLNLAAVGGTNYTWTGPNGFTSVLAQPSIPNVSLANAGDYFVTITIGNSCAVAIKTVVSITSGNPPQNIFGNSNPCANSEAKYFISPTAGSTHVWTLVSGGQLLTLPTKDTISILWSNSGNHILRLVETNTAGCSSKTDFNVSLQARPTVNASSLSPCTGDDITLTANGSGGKAPLSYSWLGVNSFNGNNAVEVISNADATMSGIYQVTVSDANACTATASTSVAVKSVPNGTISSNTPICVNSTLNLSATGGVNYVWSGPKNFSSTSNTPNVPNMQTNQAGTYNVTITNTNACTLVLSTVIVVNPNPAAITIIGDNTPCASSEETYYITKKIGSDYTWNLSSGGIFTTPVINDSIKVSWSNAAGGPHVLSITETNANGCSKVNNLNVTIVPKINVLASSGTAICGGTTVNLSASTSGGINPIMYAWTGKNNYTSTLQNPSLGAANIALDGTYFVVATDANGCKSNDSTKVKINDLPTGTINSNGPICNGATLNLSATGGILYKWSGPNGFTSIQQNPNIFNTNASISGDYKVTITDLSNCSIEKTLNVVVNPLPTAITILGNETPCANGIYTYYVTQQVGHTYNWALASGGTITSAVVNDSVKIQWNGYPGGPHFLKVLDTDANGCQRENILNVNVKASPLVVAGNNGPVCAADSIRLTAGGSAGVAPYSYAWSGVNTFTANTQNVSILNTNSSQSGLYSVVLTDATGCTAVANTTITVRALPTIVKSSNSPICETSTIKLFATGGVLYEWSGPNSFISTLQNPEIANADATKVGKYYLTVTDANGCKNRDSVTVVLSPALAATIITGKNIVCAGYTEKYKVQNPIVGHSYTWTLPAGGTIVSNPTYDSVLVQWTTVVTGVAQKLYLLDEIGSGCKRQNEIAVTVAENPILIAANSGPICAANVLYLSSSNASGTAPFMYQWTGPATFTSSVQNPEITGVTTANNGRYNVTVTDANGCKSNAYTDVDITNLPTGVVSNDGPACQGANVALSASGGLNFAWSGPNAFVSNQQNPIITDLNASKTGIYSVTITGVGACTMVKTTTVAMNTLAPSIAIIGDDTPCANSTTHYTATHTPGNNFVWTLKSGGTIVSSTTTNEIDIQWLGTAGGPHLLIFTEVEPNGCKRNDTLKVNIQAIPTATIANATAVCEGVNMTLTSSATGITPLSYAWNNGNTASDLVFTPITFSDKGTYNLTVTSATGCTTTASTFVNVYQNPIVNAGADQEICKGQQVANLSAIVDGAFGATSYAWSNGTNSNTQTVTPIATTTYRVTVTDAHACKSTDNVLVSVLDIPKVYVGKDTAICQTQMSVTLNAIATGGNGGNNFAWSNNFTGATQNVSPLATTTYIVTLTDQKGCFAKDTMTLTIWDLPITKLGIDTAICIGQQSILLDAKTTGGTGIYTYQWSDNKTTKTRLESPMVATNYRVTATDTHNCYATSSRLVEIYRLPKLQTTKDTTICVGTILELSTSPSAGNAPFTYAWSNLVNTATQKVQTAAATNYIITVTDSKGCLAKDTVKVKVSIPNKAGTAQIIPPICQTNGGVNILILNDFLDGETANGTWTYLGTSTLGTNFTGTTCKTNGLPVGKYKFRYSVAANGACTPDSEDLEIEIISCCKPIICTPVKIVKKN